MARKRGSRFRKAIDAQEQFEGIQEAQQGTRKGKRKGIIDSIKKSKQRERNAKKRIRRPEDAPPEYEVD